MSRITFHDGQDGQPEALERVAAHVRAQLAAPALDALRAAQKPLFAGIGASFAALAVPVEVLRAHGVPAQRVLSSEIEDGLTGFDTDVLLGISQGGRSSETIAAFKAAEGARTVAVLNVTPSPLAELAELAVDMGNEPDSYASTVGFTGTIVALDLIAGAIAGRDDDPWHGIGAHVRTVRERAAAAIAPLRARAATTVAADCVASGASRASAEEAALLLREVPRIPAAASATRNYLHGEMESAGNTLHLVFGDGREIDLARSLSDAGHLTLLVTAEDIAPGDHLGVVRLPATSAAPRVVLETVAVQELVQALSAERDVPIESFVFANDDTKEGGVDPGDFAIGSPDLTHA
ncbi:SIS domain-containing protein [Streptomyces sp. NBC_01304]|uniref:SIS domain-containing protein n=1 Tax=Streptomyces sp. NBC_01304 TaxID=2903818 RepID=UPI002E12AA3E|nr:SIS domain-containing protein [Streptomyces sp. NBC_01304]